jgi:hypothetical protein
MYCSHAIQILEKTQSEAFLNFQQTGTPKIVNSFSRVIRKFVTSSFTRGVFI